MTSKESPRPLIAVVRKGGIITTLVERADPARLEKYGIRAIPIFSKSDAKELAEITKLIDEKKSNRS